MIKSISIDQLEPGMYVQDLHCDWIDHPFITNQFVVRDERMIQKIRRYGIRQISIDTRKGVDVPSAQPRSEVERQVQVELQQVLEDAAGTGQTISFAEEKPVAVSVQGEANRVVSGIMHDVRLGRQIEVERVDHVVAGMISSIFRNREALLSLGRIRQMDRYTFEHSVSVAVLMIAFCKETGLPREVIHEVGVGAMLHDVGKVRIPDAVLNKPGKLNEREFALMKRHVAYGEEILERTRGISQTALAVAAQHHERVDGTGYPRGLLGVQIHRYGKMAAIADVYDAISADRVYHKGEPPTAVLRRMLEWSRYHFDPQLVQRFIQCVGIYPVGTLVRLESGRLAVVVEPGVNDLLHPGVRVVYDTEQRRYLQPQDLDLASEGAGDRIIGYESPERWGLRLEVFMP